MLNSANQLHHCCRSDSDIIFKCTAVSSVFGAFSSVCELDALRRQLIMRLRPIVSLNVQLTKFESQASPREPQIDGGAREIIPVANQRFLNQLAFEHRCGFLEF